VIMTTLSFIMMANNSYFILSCWENVKAEPQ
jgi:hypothetical protein